jgi:hypothetical protein
MEKVFVLHQTIANVKQIGQTHNVKHLFVMELYQPVVQYVMVKEHVEMKISVDVTPIMTVFNVPIQSVMGYHHQVPQYAQVMEFAQHQIVVHVLLNILV